MKYDYRFRRKINYQSCNDFRLGSTREKLVENLLILPLNVAFVSFTESFVQREFNLQVAKQIKTFCFLLEKRLTKRITVINDGARFSSMKERTNF